MACSWQWLARVLAPTICCFGAPPLLVLLLSLLLVLCRWSR